MAQSRIVLDNATRAVIDQIQEKTRTPSPSAAIALMVSRYGRHLLETWELTATRYPEPEPEHYYGSTPSPAPQSAAASTPDDFVFDEPIEL